MKKLVIFDLDGTLLNTILDLSVAVDYALSLKGLEGFSYAEYMKMVGHGITNLVKSALTVRLGQEPETGLLEESVKAFTAYYVAHIDVNTKPFEGISELLQELHAKGIRLAVASNKFHEGTVKLVDEFFGQIPFVTVMGNCPELPLKPDAEVVSQILAKAGLAEEDAILVGDSATDIKTACNAGIDSIGVEWGYRPVESLVEAGAGCLVASVAELRAKLIV